MSKQVVVKYYSEFYQKKDKPEKYEPYKASEDAAGYGLLIERFITVEAGLIDSDFRGDVKVLLFNHHPESTFTVCAGDRIAQIVFMDKPDVNFQRVTDKHLLGLTKPGSERFGSTGVSEIKKIKSDFDSKEVKVFSDENLQIVPEKMMTISKYLQKK